MGPTRINTILQSAFFELTKIIPADKANELMKAAAKATYGRKGEDIVMKNWAAIDAGAKGLHEVQVPESWKNCEDEGLDMVHATEGREDVVEFVNTVQAAVNAQEGNNLPVSAFKNYVDGSTPSGSSAYEKRGIAVNVPVWNPDNCIQCNFCSYVCPHAVIRPVVMTEEEAANAPEGTKMVPMTGMPQYKFAMTISALDCTGCGSCANVCPGKKGEKALTMASLEENLGQQEVFNYGQKLDIKQDVIDKFKETTVKGSQFKLPLLEFSGACAGCGETPYAKLLTQLFGDRMVIANTTGCSSIWGAPAPAMPYCTNEKGQGPAWQNSLFENNAEFGLGMYTADQQMKQKVNYLCGVIAEGDYSAALKDAAAKWVEGWAAHDVKAVAAASDVIVAELAAAADKDAYLTDLDAVKGFLKIRSQWIMGGDGWAYDIGYGGVDHVLASGENINIFVFDTEVYSNTGGQASKATPLAAVAQFAAAGKKTNKKDLGVMQSIYGNVYVAQIGLGANMNQAVKAIEEAEAYQGPSLIIAYAPCINHGIRKGMSIAQSHIKEAVDCGYWHLWRYNPELAKEGKNPFILDSKEPDYDKFEDFLKSETRYASLAKAHPDTAEALYAQTKELSQARYARYKEMAGK